jgi:hypothetical protein
LASVVVKTTKEEKTLMMIAQRQENKMQIKSVTKEETAYDKYIRFTYEGQEYSVLLHWDKWDGFDLQFTELERTANWVDDPEWAINWEDNNEESLSYTLEQLSDEAIEESYK